MFEKQEKASVIEVSGKRRGMKGSGGQAGPRSDRTLGFPCEFHGIL